MRLRGTDQSRDEAALRRGHGGSAHLEPLYFVLRIWPWKPHGLDPVRGMGCMVQATVARALHVYVRIRTPYETRGTDSRLRHLPIISWHSDVSLVF